MTHVPEHTFDHAVDAYLRETLAPDSLTYQAYIDSTGRVADFIGIHTTPTTAAPNIVYTVEVENDWEGVIDGTGQALMYAGHFTAGVPIVALPADHTEHPEFEDLQHAAPNVLYLAIPREYEEAHRAP